MGKLASSQNFRDLYKPTILKISSHPSCNVLFILIWRWRLITILKEELNIHHNFSEIDWADFIKTRSEKTETFIVTFSQENLPYTVYIFLANFGYQSYPIQQPTIAVPKLSNLWRYSQTIQHRENNLSLGKVSKIVPPRSENALTAPRSTRLRNERARGGNTNRIYSTWLVEKKLRSREQKKNAYKQPRISLS